MRSAGTKDPRAAARGLPAGELERLVRRRADAQAAARSLPAHALAALISDRQARRLSPPPGFDLLPDLTPRTANQQRAWERTLAKNLALPFGQDPAPASPPASSRPATSRPGPGQLSLFDHAARRLRCVRDGMKEAELLIATYERCGARPHADGAGVDRCVERLLRQMGYEPQTAARTSSKGKVEIFEVDGPCAVLDGRALRAHEAVHQRTQRRLAKRHGAGTRAFEAAWNDPVRWTRDEIAAYQAQARVYEQALGRSR